MNDVMSRLDLIGKTFFSKWEDFLPNNTLVLQHQNNSIILNILLIMQEQRFAKMTSVKVNRFHIIFKITWKSNSKCTKMSLQPWIDCEATSCGIHASHILAIVNIFGR